MNDNPLIQILTLMDGDGPTGVESHFNQLRVVLQAQGFETGLISPCVERTWGRRLPNPILRRLHPWMPERVTGWSRALDRRDLAGKLKRLALCQVGRPMMALAQDPTSALAAMQVARRHPLKVLLTIHFNLSEAQEMVDKGLIRPGGCMWQQTMAEEREALESADRIVCVSEFMRRILLDRYPWLGPFKCPVIHNSCSDPGTHPDGEETFEGDLLAIGTLEPRKNQAFLLQTLAECHRLGHCYTMNLAGDGPDRARLEALTRKLGLGNHIRFLGFVPIASRLLRTHRVLTHAALMENLPITLVEALAHGRPILAPAVGGIPEIFSNGVEGHFWPLDDPAQAAQLLIRILEDPDANRTMSLAARRRYEAHFTAQRFASEWFQLLNTLEPQPAFTAPGLNDQL